jgi:hypothetical protein
MPSRLVRATLAAALLAAAAAALVPARARAGVVNPDISVIGQPFARWSDDPADISRKRVTLHPGELELVYDAYLNPYAKGFVATSLGDDGLELEEGYFTLVRGLPAGLQLKGGKYRVPFGKLNAQHPHAVPFAERPRVLAAYLPGDESFDDTGVALSARLPAPGTFSLTAEADWLAGDPFRLARAPSGDANDPLALDPDAGDRAAESRPGVFGQLSGFGQLGERSGYEVNVSAAGGTNNVAASARTRVWGAAAKLKLWTRENAYLLVQGEFLKLARDVAAWDPAIGYTTGTVRPAGGYAYADYNLSPRVNAGVSYERFQEPSAERVVDQAVGAFVGYALLEETTAFRIDWNRFLPGTPSGATADPARVNTVTLRVVYSMGPHKAHQF